MVYKECGFASTSINKKWIKPNITDVCFTLTEFVRSIHSFFEIKSFYFKALHFECRVRIPGTFLSMQINKFNDGMSLSVTQTLTFFTSTKHWHCFIGSVVVVEPVPEPDPGGFRIGLEGEGAGNVEVLRVRRVVYWKPLQV